MKTLPVLVVILATLAARSAFAHAELDATVPADHATIPSAPEKVELRFSEPVRLTALTIQQGEAPKQDLGPLPSGAMEQFAVALPASLGEGSYVVTWRALSGDTHVMSGDFTFAVGTAVTPDADAGQGPAPAPAEPAAPGPAAHDAEDGAH